MANSPSEVVKLQNNEVRLETFQNETNETKESEKETFESRLEDEVITLKATFVKGINESLEQARNERSQILERIQIIENRTKRFERKTASPLEGTRIKGSDSDPDGVLIRTSSQSVSVLDKVVEGQRDTKETPRDTKETPPKVGLLSSKSFLGLGEGKLTSTLNYLYGTKRPEKEKMYNLLMDDFNLFVAYLIVYLDVAFEIIDSLWHVVDATTNKVIDISTVVIFYYLLNENWSNHKKNLRKEETQAISLDDFYIYSLTSLCFMIFSSYLLGALYNEGGWIQNLLLFDDVLMIAVLQLLLYSDRAKLVLPALYLIEVSIIYTVYRVNSQNPEDTKLIGINIGHIVSKSILLFFAIFHNTDTMKKFKCTCLSEDQFQGVWECCCLLNLLALFIVDLIFITNYGDLVKEDFMVIISNFIVYFHTAYTQGLFCLKTVKNKIRERFLVQAQVQTPAQTH